jgi:hypothetical protein
MEATMKRGVLYFCLLAGTFLTYQQACAYVETHQNIIKTFRAVDRNIHNLEELLNSRLSNYCQWRNTTPEATRCAPIYHALNNDLLRWCVKRMMQFTNYMPIIDCWHIYKKNGVGSDLEQEVVILKEFCIVLMAIYRDFEDQLDGHNNRLSSESKILALYHEYINQQLPAITDTMQRDANMLQSLLYANNLVGLAPLYRRISTSIYNHPIAIAIGLLAGHLISEHCLTLYKRYHSKCN